MTVDTSFVGATPIDLAANTHGTITTMPSYNSILRKPIKRMREVWPTVLDREGDTLLVKYSLDTCVTFST